MRVQSTTTGLVSVISWRDALNIKVNKGFLSSKSVHKTPLVHFGAFHTAHVMSVQVVLLGRPSGDSGVAGYACYVLGGQRGPQTF